MEARLSASAFTQGIDWRHAALKPYASQGRALVDACLCLGSVHAALEAQAAPAPIALAAGRLRFGPGDSAPAGEAYEAFIARTACVPTRENLHDFFNGLVWLHWPRTKRRLNELQAAEIARLGVGATRGPVRDALTLFDENAALLDAPPPLWEALCARDWRTLFITHRSLWDEARLVVFGHALLEKLMSPHKGVTAHVLCAQLTPATRDGARGSLLASDAALAAALSPQWLRRKPFTPLPVLGVPGWCAHSQNFSFYDDSHVFRSSASGESASLTRVLYVPAACA